MEWLNEPPAWEVRGDTLTVSAGPKTDFWRTTHSGFVRDNGHLWFHQPDRLGCRGSLLPRRRAVRPASPDSLDGCPATSRRSHVRRTGRSRVRGCLRGIRGPSGRRTLSRQRTHAGSAARPKASNRASHLTPPLARAGCHAIKFLRTSIRKVAIGVRNDTVLTLFP